MSPLRLVRQAALALGLAALLADPALAASAEASVKLARDELEQQHFDKGRAAAEQATAADSKDYRGFYYLAMAELGLGHQDLARTAVDKALTLAPASARSGVVKLSKMIGAASTAKANAAPAVVVSCTYMSTFSSSSNPKEDTPSEHSELFKIEGQSFSYWDEKLSLWKPFACPMKVNEGWTVENSCEVNERTFGFNKKESDSQSDSAHSDTLLINRLTGASEWKSLSEYGAKQPKYPGLANTFFKITRIGSCRAARDPAEAKPKF